jgi:NTE family protein
MRTGFPRWSLLALVILLLLSVSCASRVDREQPLSKWSPADKELVIEQFAGDRAPELLVLLAFSGGGTRAASFAYGVLQELAATEVMTSNGKRKLHHEVDAISSVSGGSFPSAYFGLRGDRIFEEFEERFLRKDIEGRLIARTLSPLNWFKLMSSSYSRSDVAADYYHEHVFDGATFADLRRPNAPTVIINSTDVVSGVRFPFHRQFFDLICADIDAYPVSRAVAASSAVPGLLSPIGLENFAGTCGYEPAGWLTEATKDEGITIRKDEALALEGYFDRKKRPWLHLVDGGIADNLGLRAFHNRVSMIGSLARAFYPGQPEGRRHIIMILVDARVRKVPDWALRDKVPSLPQVVGGVSGIELARYDIDTIQLVRDSFKKWARESSKPGAPVTFDFVNVSFEGVKDDEKRAFLNDVGTNFSLEDEQVDALIDAARQVLRGSPQFHTFLERASSAGTAP